MFERNVPLSKPNANTSPEYHYIVSFPALTDSFSFMVDKKREQRVFFFSLKEKKKKKVARGNGRTSH